MEDYFKEHHLYLRLEIWLNFKTIWDGLEGWGSKAEGRRMCFLGPFRYTEKNMYLATVGAMERQSLP